MIRLLFLLLAFLTPALSSGQMATYYLQTGISPNSYNGDLGGSFEKWTVLFHLGVKLNHKEKLNGNLSMAFGTLNGQQINYAPPPIDNVTPTPNTFFNTSVFTFNYDLHYNIIKKENLIVYASQGFGLMRFNPRDEFGNNFQDQFATRAANETYGNIAAIFPTTVGAIYFLPNQFGVGFQTSLLNSTTDYLDNISQWGLEDGNDNILQFRFTVYAPLSYKERALPEPSN